MSSFWRTVRRSGGNDLRLESAGLIGRAERNRDADVSGNSFDRTRGALLPSVGVDLESSSSARPSLLDSGSFAVVALEGWYEGSRGMNRAASASLARGN